MISLEQVVYVIFYLIIAAMIFGLLWIAIIQAGKLFPNEASGPVVRLAQVLLILLAVFVCIAFLLSLLGHPIIRW